MDAESRQPDGEDELTTALRELDAAKALMRDRQLELTKAVPALAPRVCSPDDLHVFAAGSKRMNEAVERHRRAVSAFNVACRKKPQPMDTVSLPFGLIPAK